MKRLITLFFIILPLFSFAHEEVSQGQIYPPKNKEIKHYVDPTQIGFSNNKIFINFDEEWHSVDAIYADKEGIYIKSSYVNSPWKCNTCSIINEFWRSTCKTEECTGTRPPKYSIPKPPLPPYPPQITPK